MINPAALSLSFFAGIAIFFSPCGIALLPAYISFLLDQKEEETNKIKRAVAGLKIGAIVSLGILTVFITVGVLISFLGNFLAPYAFWLGTITGAALIILGIFMLIGKGLTINLPHNFKAQSNVGKFYIFGMGYAIGGISCTLPAFLLVVFNALGSGSFLGGFVNFLAFSLGTVLLMLAVTTATAISKSFIERWIVSKMTMISKLASLVIIGAGAYLIYFNFLAFVL